MPEFLPPALGHVSPERLTHKEVDITCSIGNCHDLVKETLPANEGIVIAKIHEERHPGHIVTVKEVSCFI